jgi:hypothetical protein
MAAGLNSFENLEAFRQRLNEVFRERIRMRARKKWYRCRCQVTMADVDSTVNAMVKQTWNHLGKKIQSAVCFFGCYR